MIPINITTALGFLGIIILVAILLGLRAYIKGVLAELDSIESKTIEERHQIKTAKRYRIDPEVDYDSK